MSNTSYKLDKTQRSLMQRLFEPPTVGKMSPAANIVAYSLLAFWSAFVLFPLYWVLITAFKDAQIVNEGPYYIPFVDFQPTLDGWRAIAISLVMFSHGFDALREAFDWLGPYKTESMKGLGLLGVQVFFGLSGFLITSRLLSEEQRHGSISLRQFYARRVFRILPVVRYRI